MTKKCVLWISGIVSVVLLSINFYGVYKTCGLNSGCAEILSSMMTGLLIIFPTFLLSLITYKMREETFRSWIKFASAWIPLTLICVLITPEYSNSWLPIFQKGFISFFMSVLFLIISLVIIVVKYFSSRNMS